MSNIVLVDWWQGDTYETLCYRRCDFCYETACEDIWAGLSEDDWRQFFEVVGEFGLTVCSNCLPRLNEED